MREFGPENPLVHGEKTAKRTLPQCGEHKNCKLTAPGVTRLSLQVHLRCTVHSYPSHLNASDRQCSPTP